MFDRCPIGRRRGRTARPRCDHHDALPRGWMPGIRHTGVRHIPAAGAEAKGVPHCGKHGRRCPHNRTRRRKAGGGEERGEGDHDWHPAPACRTPPPEAQPGRRQHPRDGTPLRMTPGRCRRRGRTCPAPGAASAPHRVGLVTGETRRLFDAEPGRFVRLDQLGDTEHDHPEERN